MSQAATLPAGWAQILDDIRGHLDAAVAATDARIAMSPVADIAPASSHQQTFGDICQKLQGLTERLRSAEQLIDETDRVLQAEETRLQQHQAACRLAPQRLTDWAARRDAR